MKAIKCHIASAVTKRLWEMPEGVGMLEAWEALPQSN
jgi:hypothetical protein